MKKRRIFSTGAFCALFIGAGIPLCAFGWPRLADTVAVFFAQKYGGTFNRGLVFNDPAEVAAAEDGQVLITIREDGADNGLFPSTLGNAVILSHKDHILTVYGGLEKNSVDDGSGHADKAAAIGISGYSGWGTGRQSLQFQVIDTKIKAVINPLILIEGDAAAKKFVIKNVTAVSKNGNKTVLSNGMSIAAGTYVLYTDASEITMPYTTSVSVNGTLAEKTDYTALKTAQEKLCVQGSAQYDFSAIYSDKGAMRLAEILLVRGKNTLDISVQDIGLHETSFHLTLNAF
ncbi:hypothetical protein HMPREF9194_00681 [Treponema maltophilum ATCC 51939]|uniref:M23ase beta-sheet core domain-containing protein n=1 Tax=Treponema maltophilum ATCC 51939 TaxID=1125699 RepID=S3L0S5_TREMA|nr:M23 family metallopeptidase [Treponema maltophilum]EPF30364.1 hypothetical protein HMPREF9194_00681 [Treponema maltophilum ATCC 51939]